MYMKFNNLNNMIFGLENYISFYTSNIIYLCLLKVDLQKYYKVAGIATQGRGDVAQWVKHYWVMFSLDGEKFYYVTRNDRNRQVRSTGT